MNAVDLEVKEQGLTDSSLTDTASMPRAMFPNYSVPNSGKRLNFSFVNIHG
jgi:hypothetical protein